MFIKRSYLFVFEITLVPVLFFGIIVSNTLFAICHAQQPSITSDGTLGSIVTLDQSNYTISEGTILGNNQFHSFGQFNVFQGESATFTGPNTINNIIGRVTGGSQSFIDGLLRSDINGANLYLLNPSGILFGPNASLDVSGSFHVSTADYLRFDDGEQFYVNPAENSVLTVAQPQAFGFLSESPTRIYIQESLLEVPEGETLSVISGNIEIVGGILQAPGGRLNLASVASSGEVIPNAQDEKPDLKMDTFERLGEIDISKGGKLQSSGANGNIFIRGGSLSLDSSGIYSTTWGAAGDLDIRLAEDLSLTNRSYIDSSSYWSGPAGDILLDVGRLTISDGSIITSHAMDECTSQWGNIMIRAAEFVSISSGGGDNYMQSYISSSTFGDGDGGTVSVSTPTLIIDEHAGIFAVAYMGFDWFGNVVGGGRAGDIFIDVGSLTITSAGIGCVAGGMTTGHAGNITITATESVSIDDGAIRSSTFGAGDGGTISISTPVLTADSSGILAEAGEYASGNAGEILLEVGSLALSNGAQITTSTDGAGSGGDVTVTATDSISISGHIIESNAMYHSAIISSTYGDGNGGTISISTPSLTIDDGALASETGLGAGSGGDIFVEVGDLTISNGGLISTMSFGVGNAGDISITASDTFHSNNSLVATAAEQGEGGDINITTREMQLLNGTIVSAESSGAGNAGNIYLAATDSFLMRDSAVVTQAIQADGGNIKVSAEDMVYLIDSEITASVGGGPETVGGNVSIDPEYVILKNSKIIANAYEGMGGNIQIITDVFIADSDSVVDASSQLGIDGIVDIRAGTKVVSQSLKPLSEKYKSAVALLREPCTARAAGGKYSSFVISGRDALPIEPGGLLPSPISQ